MSIVEELITFFTLKDFKVKLPELKTININKNEKNITIYNDAGVCIVSPIFSIVNVKRLFEYAKEILYDITMGKELKVHASGNESCFVLYKRSENYYSMHFSYEGEMPTLSTYFISIPIEVTSSVGITFKFQITLEYPIEILE